jgi:hypothetical protein
MSQTLNGFVSKWNIRPSLLQRACAAAATPDCPTCGGEGSYDVGPGDAVELVACACTRLSADTDDAAPAPVRAVRRYTFAVYLEAPEAIDADDYEDGYTRQDVEALIKRLLSSYATRAEAREFQTLGLDWELLDSELVDPARR